MAIIVGFIYLGFLTVLLYAVLFVGDLGARRAIDLGPAGPALQAWVIDGTLLALFALLQVALTHVRSEPGGRSGAGRRSPSGTARSRTGTAASRSRPVLLGCLRWRSKMPRIEFISAARLRRPS